MIPANSLSKAYIAETNRENMPVDPYKNAEHKLLVKIITQVPEAAAFQARIKFRHARGQTKADLSSLPDHIAVLITEKMRPQ